MNLFLTHHIAQLGWLVYPLIIATIFFEGEAVIYSVMFLSYQGTLNIYASLASICFSVLMTDASSYALGYYGTKTFPRIARFYEKLMSPLDDRLRSMSFVVFLVSKFTYGLHRAVVIRSGMLRVSFKKFMRIDILTSLVWVGTIAGFAYGSWRSIHYLHRSLRYAEIVLALGIVLLLVASHIVSRISKKRLLENKK